MKELVLYQRSLSLITQSACLIREVTFDKMNMEIHCLEDPSHFRPIKEVNKRRDIALIPNFGITIRKNSSPFRGAPKDTKFTKKFSTTLIRPDFRTLFFRDIYKSDQNSVTFMYDLFKVKNKNWKYVFKKDIGSWTKPWLNPSFNEENFLMKNYIPIEKLRESVLIDSINNFQFTTYNEILVGVSLDSMMGLIVREKELQINSDEIFNILNLYFHIYEKFHISLPIFYSKNPTKNNFSSHCLEIIDADMILNFMQENANNPKFGQRRFQSYITGNRSFINNSGFIRIPYLKHRLSQHFLTSKEKFDLTRYYENQLNNMKVKFRNAHFSGRIFAFDKTTNTNNRIIIHRA